MNGSHNERAAPLWSCSARCSPAVRSLSFLRWQFINIATQLPSVAAFSPQLWRAASLLVRLGGADSLIKLGCWRCTVHTGLLIRSFSWKCRVGFPNFAGRLEAFICPSWFLAASSFCVYFTKRFWRDRPAVVPRSISNTAARGSITALPWDSDRLCLLYRKCTCSL